MKTCLDHVLYLQWSSIMIFHQFGYLLTADIKVRVFFVQWRWTNSHTGEHLATWAKYASIVRYSVAWRQLTRIFVRLQRWKSCHNPGITFYWEYFVPGQYQTYSLCRLLAPWIACNIYGLQSCREYSVPGQRQSESQWQVKMLAKMIVRTGFTYRMYLIVWHSRTLHDRIAVWS